MEEQLTGALRVREAAQWELRVAIADRDVARGQADGAAGTTAAPGRPFSAERHEKSPVSELNPGTDVLGLAVFQMKSAGWLESPV